MRPYYAGKIKRSKQISVTLLPDEHAYWKECAVSDGQNMSNFVRTAVASHCRKLQAKRRKAEREAAAT